jgi:hypothetical protein
MPRSLIDPQTKIFLKGKHEGETLESVDEYDRQYLLYLQDSAEINEADYLIIAEYLKPKR